jgi:5'-nucleotidase
LPKRFTRLKLVAALIIVKLGDYGEKTVPLFTEFCDTVLILLTNDDGIYAPGLAALGRQLQRLGEVRVVAPASEQSGVGHSITYLTPLIVKEVFVADRPWGWAVEGSPADCVKLGISQFCPRRPDLIVSGINYGLNAGINVLYSGTVAAAIEGAFFEITSVAVSMEFSEAAPFEKAARLACTLIEQILEKKGAGPQLYNMNIPSAALEGTPEVRVVPMDVAQYGERFEKRMDPWGRDYYWATGLPPPPTSQRETDLTALAKGYITLTPLDYDLTRRELLAQMAPWQFRLASVAAEEDGEPVQRPVVRNKRRSLPILPDDGAGVRS